MGALAGAGPSPAWGARAAAASTMPRLPADAAANRIVASVRRPHFPDRPFPVTRFGAVGDGVTKNTAAFAAAISACGQSGGGHVVVPPGQFLTGAVHLLSNVDLHVEAGATILFSQDPADYLPVVFTRWQGIELMNYSPFIYAYGQRNIAVTGAGTLNGQADANHWWGWKPLENTDFTALETMADNNVPVAQRVFGSGHFLPPQMIQPFLCDTVLLAGVTVINSPFWHLNPNLCGNVTVDGLTISSSGPNTDGCDPESCAGVVVRNVTFDTGDDCIAIKAGRDTDGRRVGVPCQDGRRPAAADPGHLQRPDRELPPDVTGVTLRDWSVQTCAGVWSIVGASATDPVGTVTLEDLAITASTAPDSARDVTNLVVKDVTVGGVPVTA